jgi:LPXTG-site transpeptidase (sortase) family protein
LFVTGVALLTATQLTAAEPGSQEDARDPSNYWIWIQDPWTGETKFTSVREPDQSLWDPTQIKDYEKALQEEFPPPLGVLTINSLDIQVPVYNGADDHTLDRGAGRVKGMAKMDEDAHLAISAHRDSFFRGLKDIQLGDDILLQSAMGVERFAVSDITIVPKEDASVLEQTDSRTLTLITCYPFYHVGHAPKRYIVTALPVPAPEHEPE